MLKPWLTNNHINVRNALGKDLLRKKSKPRYTKQTKNINRDYKYGGIMERQSKNPKEKY